ncbi:MAG: glycosyltransferase family 4 protein, partial [Actinomycetota bacterium]|nr:glycosyltransferase family 4 protein [Actinomycetota bacterium]
MPARTRSHPDAKRPPSVAFLLETGAANPFWSTAVQRVSAAGFRTSLVTVQGRGPLHGDVEERGVRPFALSAAGVKDYPRAAASLGRFLRREHVDVLHSCAAIQATVGGMGCLFAPRTIHAFQRQHMQINSREQEWFTSVGSRLSNYTLAISEATATWAKTKDGVPASKVRTVYLGIPAHRSVGPGEVVALRTQLGIPTNARILVLAGFMRVEKGHRVLLDALPSIRAGVDDPVHVVFVGGTGPEEEALRALCADDRAIHLMGFQKDLSPWFALADVVVMPSLFEAFGLVAVEAFAARRPLVASDVGGLQEVVEDGSGMLVPPGDPRALGQAVIEVLSSPQRARTMASAGYRRFERHFTVDAMVRGWT